MLRKYKQIAIAMVCGVTIFLAQSPAHSAGTASDVVGKGWKSRAEAATKRLAAPGLDKCDNGVELAFQKPNEVTSGKQRSFELIIDIDKQEMVASYTYEGQRLTSFVLLALPPGWLVVQKTDSKSLNILVTVSNCSFDLCTNDPFTAGPCVK
jgi:hypothetical protein